MNNDATMWIIVVSLASLGANVATIIVSFRRKPPIEAEFATKDELQLVRDQKQSKTDCELKHHAVKSDEALSAQFVTRREWKITVEEQNKCREEIRKDLKVLLQRTARFAGFGEENA